MIVLGGSLPRDLSDVWLYADTCLKQSLVVHAGHGWTIIIERHAISMENTGWGLLYEFEARARKAPI